MAQMAQPVQAGTPHTVQAAPAPKKEPKDSKVLSAAARAMFSVERRRPRNRVRLSNDDLSEGLANAYPQLAAEIDRNQARPVKAKGSDCCVIPEESVPRFDLTPREEPKKSKPDRFVPQHQKDWATVKKEREREHRKDEIAQLDRLYDECDTLFQKLKDREDVSQMEVLDKLTNAVEAFEKSGLNPDLGKLVELRKWKARVTVLLDPQPAPKLHHDDFREAGEDHKEHLKDLVRITGMDLKTIEMKLRALTPKLLEEAEGLVTPITTLMQNIAAAKSMLLVDGEVFRDRYNGIVSQWWLLQHLAKKKPVVQSALNKANAVLTLAWNEVEAYQQAYQKKQQQS